jgi:peptidoglycan/LPS O-acetylase OafA/YrhL
MDNVFVLTFLNGLQIENTHTQINGWGCVFTSWYVSVLLWISLFFYFIVSNFGFKLLLLLLWIFIISGLYCSHYGLQTIVHHDVLRGLYSMSIGCVLGQIFFLYKEKALNAIIKVKTRIINTFFELGLLGYLLYAIITTKSHLAKIDIIFLFVLLMIFFIFKLGFLSKILDNNFSKLLGQYSYSIFLSHSVLMHVYKKFWYIEMNMQTFWTSIHGVVLSIIICVMFGVFVYYLVEKPSYSYLKRKYNL